MGCIQDVFGMDRSEEMVALLASMVVMDQNVAERWVVERQKTLGEQFVCVRVATWRKFVVGVHWLEEMG